MTTLWTQPWFSWTTKKFDLGNYYTVKLNSSTAKTQQYFLLAVVQKLHLFIFLCGKYKKK